MTNESFPWFSWLHFQEAGSLTSCMTLSTLSILYDILEEEESGLCPVLSLCQGRLALSIGKDRFAEESSINSFNLPLLIACSMAFSTHYIIPYHAHGFYEIGKT